MSYARNSHCRDSIIGVIATALAAAGCGQQGQTAPAKQVATAEAAAASEPVKASFFTFNMCGAKNNEYCKRPHVSPIVDFVVAHRPTAFALQEVCGHQADEISRALRERGLDYVQRYRNMAALPGGVAPNCGYEHAGQGEGIALFHVGTTLGEVREGNFATLSCADYLPVEYPLCRLQPRGYVCVKVPQVQVWACSTHIEVKEHVQKAQIAELAEVTQELNAPAEDEHRVPLVLGGDFNVNPDDDKLNAMFDRATYARGEGTSFEHDVSTEVDSTGAHRVFPEAAATQGSNKYDYIFHSATVSVEESLVVPPVGWSVPEMNSDHRLLENHLLLPAVGGD